MPFIELLSIDSTNNYALTQIHAGLTQHGAAFFAHEQVAGKGQRGKTWTAPKDSSLIVSIVIDPQPLQVTQQFQFNACVAVSVCEFFGHYAGNDTSIKWPNDLYWYDRKAGGILIENIIGSRKKEVGSQKSGVGSQESEVGSQESGVGSQESGVRGRKSDPDSYREKSEKSDLSTINPIAIGSQLSTNWLWAVTGIGININQTSFPEGLKNPVSLKQITGKDFDPAELAKELCLIIDKNFKKLITTGFEDIYASYLTRLYKKNETVKLKKDNRVFEAVLKSVSLTGELIVEHAIEESFGFGEIEWVITTNKPGK